MTDVFPSEKRSWIMSRVREKNTSPELKIRSLIHRAGFRYRLHGKNLPGKPDLVFSSRKKVIFVHGCFWHGHDCVRGARAPKTNAKYWHGKIGRNAERDAKNQAELKSLGWKVLVIWECELGSPQNVSKRICRFLSGK